MRPTTISDDADILNVRAHHPTCGELRYERVRQDRRTYYRLLANGKGTGSLTDREHATFCIFYWHEKGWC